MSRLFDFFQFYNISDRIMIIATPLNLLDQSHAVVCVMPEVSRARFMREEMLVLQFRRSKMEYIYIEYRASFLSMVLPLTNF
jgi:hypothetical protein